jgi:hypothetical protein
VLQCVAASTHTGVPCTPPLAHLLEALVQRLALLPADRSLVLLRKPRVVKRRPLLLLLLLLPAGAGCGAVSAAVHVHGVTTCIALAAAFSSISSISGRAAVGQRQRHLRATACGSNDSTRWVARTREHQTTKRRHGLHTRTHMPGCPGDTLHTCSSVAASSSAPRALRTLSSAVCAAATLPRTLAASRWKLAACACRALISAPAASA